MNSSSLGYAVGRQIQGKQWAFGAGGDWMAEENVTDSECLP